MDDSEEGDSEEGGDNGEMEQRRRRRVQRRRRKVQRRRRKVPWGKRTTAPGFNYIIIVSIKDSLKPGYHLMSKKSVSVK